MKRQVILGISGLICASACAAELRVVDHVIQVQDHVIQVGAAAETDTLGLEYDGTNDYIATTNSDTAFDFDLDDDFSVVSSFKLTTVPNGSGYALLSKSAGSSPWWFCALYDADGSDPNVYMQFEQGGAYRQYIYSSSLTAGGDHCVAWVYDGGVQSCRIYLDGAEVAATTTNASGSLSTILNDGQAQVGRRGDNNVWFHGTIYQTAVYSRELTSNEAATATGSLGDTIPADGKVAVWRGPESGAVGTILDDDTLIPDLTETNNAASKGGPKIVSSPLHD